MDKLLIPATFMIHAAEKQKDSRYVAATINFVYEGTYFGKYLFSCSAVDDAAPSIANISIMSEDGDCAVGVIPESNGYAWGLVLDNGTWRNYLQLDCLFWTKTNQDAAISADNSGKAFDLEVELSIEGNTENDTYTVESFTVEGVRLLSSAVSANDFTVRSNRYGALPMKKRKGGMMNGR